MLTVYHHVLIRAGEGARMAARVHHAPAMKGSEHATIVLGSCQYEPMSPQERNLLTNGSECFFLLALEQPLLRVGDTALG